MSYKYLKKYIKDKEFKKFKDFDLEKYFSKSYRTFIVENIDNGYNLIDIIKHNDNIIIYNVSHKTQYIHKYYDDLEDFIESTIKIYKKNSFDIYGYNKIIKKLNLKRFCKDDIQTIKSKLYIYLIESYTDKINLINNENISDINEIVEFFGSKLNFLSYCEDLFDKKIN